MIRRLGFVLAIVALVSGAGLLLRAEPPQEVGSWASIGAAPENRIRAAAVALADGRTLIAGGLADGTPTAAVVVFDPADSSFAAAGQLLEPRAGHTATLLEDGHVLIAGGTVNALLSGDVEIFDPSTGTSTLVATLAQLRKGHAAARFGDGKVLIAGGTGTDGVLQTAEIFDPADGSISLAGSALNFPRTGASATALIDGRVLIAGGSDGNQDLLSAEIYNPSTDTFQQTDTNLDTPRSNHTAVLLPNNGSVLIAGGTSDGLPLATTDLFLPAQFPDPFSYGMGQFALTGEMAAPRSGAAGGPHIEGYAFVVGGGQPDAEVYRFVTIKTDRDDYAPGQRAIITGSGWEANEEVRLLFQEDPAVHDDYVLTVTADGEGNIYHDEWAPEEHDLGVRFYLMAAGQQSGHRAQTTFTDSINVDINGATFQWHRTGEASGGFNVSVSGTYTCTTGGGNNSCSAVTNLTITVPGVAGSKVITGLTNPATNAAWGPVTLEFRTAPGSGQFAIPSDGKFNITATLNTNAVNSPSTDSENNYFGVDNTAPVTGIQCNGATCANPYNGTVQVKLNASDGPASTGSGVASTVYCVDTTNACTPGTPYPGGAGFSVAYDAGVTHYIRYSSTDEIGNIETTTSQPIMFAAANTAPVAVDDSATVNEDSAGNVIEVLANDTDADNVSPTPSNTGLTVTAVGAASHGTATLTAGVITYTPSANYCGPDSFNYTVSDNGTSNAGHTDQGAVSMTVTCINDAPTFTKGADPITVLEDSGAYSAAWATAIADGDPEVAQTLNFIVSNNNNGLFSSQPAIAPDGTLTFTPAANAAGSATVTVQIHDDGGTANGGVDTSAAQTFAINVTAVNDEPSFTKGADPVTVNEDSGAYSQPWATAIDDGDLEANQTLTFHVSNDNNALFSAQPAISSTGTLTFTPAANANGSAVVSVYLTDDGGTGNGGDDTSPTQTFTITVNAVNDAPSFTKGDDPVTVLEDSGAYSAAWANAISDGDPELDQTVDFIVSNDNPSLFSAQPAVAPNGTLSFTPAANANGTATVTVKIHDDGGTANGGVDTSDEQTFTIDVTAVNDEPSFTKGADPVTVDEDSGAYSAAWATTISDGDPEVDQTLTFHVSNDNNALFSSQPAISSSGNLTFTPAADAFGSAVVSVYLTDDGGTANSGDDTSGMQTFTITVNAVNDVPSFTKGDDQSVLVNAGAQSVAGWATSLSAGPPNESGQTLSFIVSNNNPALFSVQPAVAANGTLTFTPALNAAGSALVSVQVHDNGGTANGGVDTSAAQTFVISVQYSTESCLGSPGLQILQPINVDGSSTFKQKSTVPAKFRVCDANGTSIGTPGVVTDFRLIQIINGGVTPVNEEVDSTTPDTAFRWSATDQQWIFNINTKNLVAGKQYRYRITLNSGQMIEFGFALK